MTVCFCTLTKLSLIVSVVAKNSKMMHRAVSTMLLALLTLLVSMSSGHNLIIGSRPWADHELHREAVKEDSSWLNWFSNVKKQLTFTGDGVSKITQIKALDQARDGKGANVVLVAGGPGQTYATLKFESQGNNPINFIVEIYGKVDR